MKDHSHPPLTLCKHDFDFCEKCNGPYCKSCGKEWREACTRQHSDWNLYQSGGSNAYKSAQWGGLSTTATNVIPLTSGYIAPVQCEHKP